MFSYFFWLKTCVFGQSKGCKKKVVETQKKVKKVQKIVHFRPQASNMLACGLGSAGAISFTELVNDLYPP